MSYVRVWSAMEQLSVLSGRVSPTNVTLPRLRMEARSSSVALISSGWKPITSIACCVCVREGGGGEGGNK